MSVELEMKCEGLEELQQKVQRLDSTMKTKVQQQLANLAESIKETGKQIVPIRTGYLRSTIFTETQEWTVKVGSNAHYAVYVEFGTRFMRGFHFLSRTLEIHLPYLTKLIDNSVGEAITEAST
jgi:HK97 gp10 family phage protein